MIGYIPLFLASTPPELPVPSTPAQNLSPWVHSIIIVAGSMLALFCVALAIIWIFKNGNKTKENSDASPENGQAKNWLGFKKRHKKYKKRYPTLADVGGLPPKRTETNNNPQSNVQQ